LAEEDEYEDNSYLLAPNSSSLYCQGVGLFSYAQQQVASALPAIATMAQENAKYCEDVVTGTI